MNFQDKIETAVKQYNEVDQKIRVTEEQLSELRNAREQLRGKVITYQELESEQRTSSPNGSPNVEPVIEDVVVADLEDE